VIDPGPPIDPEQAAFRRALRARTRPMREPDDDDWQPHRRWGDPVEPGAAHPGGRPRHDNPSKAALYMRRRREREAREQSVPSPNKSPL